MYRSSSQWKRIRNRVLVAGESRRSVAMSEHISRNTLRKMLTYEAPPKIRRRSGPAALGHSARGQVNRDRSQVLKIKQRWSEWLYALERGGPTDELLAANAAELQRMLYPAPNNPRKKILVVLARAHGFSLNATAEHLGISRNTARKYIADFDAGGIDALLGKKKRARKADDCEFKEALFSLLHEPPALSGYNRTTWRMDDLRETLASKGHPACTSVIHEAIRTAGFRWRSAKVVLTSNDPSYKEKLQRVQTVLSSLGAEEKFFSIDEFGPFAIKAKPGRVLAAPGSHPSVAQWQKSKGWLIATAALELASNQVTHFYSRAKNTAEMICMVRKLLDEHRSARTLYISWDAASWHMSKKLLDFVDQHNLASIDAPRVELVPLPASAQFLNVIESVFSGMARAIIHNSDYESVAAATAAIDRYFGDRNRYFRENPKRAGKKIWGRERTEPAFDAANNCKDPAYR